MHTQRDAEQLAKRRRSGEWRTDTMTPTDDKPIADHLLATTRVVEHESQNAGDKPMTVDALIREPVATIVDRAISWYAEDIAHLPAGTALYAAPQSRVPLTDEQVASIINDSREADEGPTAFVRRVERAHGIRSEG